MVYNYFMKTLKQTKFLMITLSLLVLVGCDQYEFVNLDEYLIIKKDKTKDYPSEIKWSGLNISTKVTTKYMDGRLHYIIFLEDLDGGPIQETDYFENLINNGELRLTFRDIDGFKLHDTSLPIINFTNVTKGNKRFSIREEDSVQFKESEYVKINQVNVGTIGV